MTDHQHGKQGSDHGHGDLFRLYMTIAAVLAVCTALSFVFNYFAGIKTISLNAAFFLILGVALVKAGLVGFYFMHLKWDWNTLYFLIVPVSILGVMMAVVFLPDTLIGPSKDAAEEYEIALEAAPKK